MRYIDMESKIVKTKKPLSRAFIGLLAIILLAGAGFGIFYVRNLLNASDDAYYVFLPENPLTADIIEAVHQPAYIPTIEVVVEDPQVEYVAVADEWVTRGQFARLVAEVLGTPQERYEIFDDVPLDSDFNPWVTSAVNRSIIFPARYGSDFGADYPITREEAIAWTVRSIGIFIGNEVPSFYDTNEILYQYEIARAVELGLISPTPDNLFEPSAWVTHDEAAELITATSHLRDGLRLPENIEEASTTLSTRT